MIRQNNQNVPEICREKYVAEADKEGFRRQSVECIERILRKPNK